MKSRMNELESISELFNRVTHAEALLENKNGKQVHSSCSGPLLGMSRS